MSSVAVEHDNLAIERIYGGNKLHFIGHFDEIYTYRVSPCLTERLECDLEHSLNWIVTFKGAYNQDVMEVGGCES